MMTMLDDLRLALRQICRAMGLPANAATVVSLVVLGVALNIVALRAVESVGIGRRHACHGRGALSSAARTELKVARTVVVSTLKKIGNGSRRWCLAQQCRTGEQMKGTGYDTEGGFDRGTATEGCNAMSASSAARKMAITVAQC